MDKKLRAMEVVKRHILQGEKVKDIAKDMNVSQDTIQRSLQWARTANLFVQYEQRMFDELLPLAHEAIKMALADGDAQVALKVYDSLGLGPGRHKAQSHSAREDEEGLYGEILKARQGWTIDVTPGAPGALESPDDTFDVVCGPDEEPGTDGHEGGQTGEGESGGEDSASDAQDPGGGQE